MIKAYIYKNKIHRIQEKTLNTYIRTKSFSIKVKNFSDFTNKEE